MEQGPIAPAEAHHGVVDGRVPVGIELHGGPHHIGGLGAAPAQQLHLVHGVQQLAVGGLEAVDLRDGPGDDDRHGVGHIVELQRLGDGLFQHLGPQAHDVGVIYFFGAVLLGAFFLSQMDNRPSYKMSRCEAARALGRFRCVSRKTQPRFRGPWAFAFAPLQASSLSASPRF